jgi:hypothetical protein
MPAVEGIVHDAMKQYGLKAIIAMVNSGGQNIYTEAVGESMTGVPATNTDSIFLLTLIN